MLGAAYQAPYIQDHIRTSIKWRPAGIAMAAGFCLAGRWWTEEKPTAETIEDAIEAMTQYFLNHPHMAGCCRRQLTDVEGEFNGIYTDDRKLKFHPVRLKEIFGKAPAVKRD